MIKKFILIIFLLKIAQCSKYQFIWTVTNPHPHYTSFCVYLTPAEGIINWIFQVHRIEPNPKEIGYWGVMASRVPPAEESYMILAPGESFHTFVDIPAKYDLSSLSEPGIYEINTRGLTQREVKIGDYKPSALLPTKLELLPVPVELEVEDFETFKERKEIVELNRQGSFKGTKNLLASASPGVLVASKPLRVTITPNTKLYESYVDYSEDEGSMRRKKMSQFDRES